jgi:type IV pilus assembly protein PilW
MKRTSSYRRARGFSLIEIMVGIVIALIAVLVIYQVFDVAEGIKRNVTGAGDAQQNGLLSTFGMALQFSDAGANIAVAGDSLDACPFGTGVPVDDIKNTLRPVPVLITDSGDDTLSDSFVVNYGSSERLVTPTNFASAPTIALGATGDTYVVQSPQGFQKDDVIVVISNDAAGNGTCARSVATAVSDPDGDGYVTITHGATEVQPVGKTTVTGDAALLDLGPSPRRILFDVKPVVAGDNCLAKSCTLRSQEIFNVNAADPTNPFAALDTPVPIANNIVLMKVQYGIADPATGFLQKWVKATNADEDWSPAGILGNGVGTPGKSYQDLSRIKAVRIALIVRSESYDKCAYANQCPDPTTNTFSYTLFSQCDGLPCPDPITGSLDPTPGKGNFRYRVYETVVPLRNAVWNLHKAT